MHPTLPLIAALALASFQAPQAGQLASASGGTAAATAGVTITSVSPQSSEIVAVDGGPLVHVFGTGMSGVTGVRVDGVDLLTFPSQFTIVSDTELTFKWPLAKSVGPVPIILFDAGGSATTSVTATLNAAPTINMIGSDPGYIFQPLGLGLTVSGDPGDLVFVFGSPDLIPTKLTPWADMDLAIGDDNRSLFVLGSPIIGPEGYASLLIPMKDAPTGFKVHVQTMLVKGSSGYAPQLYGSNVQSGTVLF